MAAPAAPSAHDRARVCGLIVEHGEAARSATYERAWERDAATWRAVQQALLAAAAGRAPRTPAAEPPAWLGRVVQAQLDRLAHHHSWVPAFDDVRRLERLGLVDLPTDDTYVLAVVGGVGDSTGSRADALRADPELVERVLWRMFEVEGGGEVSLANLDKYGSGGATWRATFVELVADGTLDRKRVLVSALSALNRDFSAYRAGWYARLYEALSPTPDEAARHQDLVRALLRSGVAATVGLAVKELHRLSKQGRLDDEAAVAALPPAVLANAKGTALAAVRLVSEAVRRTPAVREPAIAAAAAALQHPHADVQRAAAALLEDLGAGDVTARAVDGLEPSVRQSLGISAAVVEPVRSEPVPAPSPPMPPAAGRLDVLDRMAGLLEDASDPVELEVVLAGIAALEDPKVLQPLAKRAAAVLGRGPRDDVIPGWLRGQLARMVLLATGQAPVTMPVPTHHLAFLLLRLADVASVLTGGQPPKVLLATPTDPAGWLAPSVLVDRLQASGAPPARHDLIAALLRLHPQGRDTALRQLLVAGAAVDVNTASAVGYALGGEPPAGAGRRWRRSSLPGDQSVWVAASRARGPLVHDHWLEQQGVVGAGRSQPIEAAVEFTPRPYSWSDHRDGSVHSAVTWSWQTTVAGRTAPPSPDEPTCPSAEQQQGRLLGQRCEDFVPWIALTFPHDAEHFLVDGVDAVLDAAAFDEVNHDAVRVLAALGAHPGRLGHLSVTALAAGLTAGKADQRANAVDAVHTLHRQGRLPAGDLGAGLRHLVGPATLTRWAASLRELAAIDTAANLLVRDALTALLPVLEPGTRSVHALIELLNEELLRAGAPTPPALQPWLARFQGGSRAATAAATLLGRM